MTEQPCTNSTNLVVKIMVSFWEILFEFKATEARIQSKVSLQEARRNHV